MQRQIHWDGKKGLEHALLCELCKAKIYAIYSNYKGMKVCYRCKGEDADENDAQD